MVMFVVPAVTFGRVLDNCGDRLDNALRTAAGKR
jgi:hypothetical protein